MYLLELDSKKREILYTGYNKDAYKNAAEAYANREREVRDDQDIHVVLVSTPSLHELKTAYPSFFLDSTGFIQLLRQQIFGQE